MWARRQVSSAHIERSITAVAQRYDIEARLLHYGAPFESTLVRQPLNDIMNARFGALTMVMYRCGTNFYLVPSFGSLMRYTTGKFFLNFFTDFNMDKSNNNNSNNSLHEDWRFCAPGEERYATHVMPNAFFLPHKYCDSDNK
jgi:hypothetical protein